MNDSSKTHVTELIGGKENVKMMTEGNTGVLQKSRFQKIKQISSCLT
jgi:hypothetical protein